MKLLLTILLFFSVLGFSQELNIQDLAKKQNQLHKETLFELGLWSTMNMGYGWIAAAQTPMGEAKYFHQMNAGWNVVNASIVAIGFFAQRKSELSGNFRGVLEAQYKAEQVYLVNTVLDLSYITGGLLLRQYANQLSGEGRYRALGFGSSIVLQGGYLMLHDLVTFFRFKRLRKNVDSFWNQVSLTSNYGFGVKVSL